MGKRMQKPKLTGGDPKETAAFLRDYRDPPTHDDAGRPQVLDVVSLAGTVVESFEDGAIVEFTDEQGRGVMLIIPWPHFDSSRSAAERQLHEARTQLERTMRYAAKQEALHNDAKHDWETTRRRAESAEAQLKRCQEALREVLESAERDVIGSNDRFVRVTLKARSALSPNTPETE
jgi:hypothetical protein